MRLPGCGSGGSMRLQHSAPHVHALVRMDASRLQVLASASRLTLACRTKVLTARSPGGARLGAAVALAGTYAVRTAGAGAGSSGSERPLTEFGNPKRRITDLLLALNVAAFGLQMASKGSMLAWGAKVNPAIAHGELYRLVTCTFLHGNLMHLYFNCSALASLGPYVEACSGPVRYTAVYAISAIAGSLFSYFCSPSVSVGASGAIFGLGSATALHIYRHRRNNPKFSGLMLKSLGQSLALNVFIGLTNPSIDNWGHLGGFVGGALASFILGPNYKLDGDGRVCDSAPFPLLAKAVRGA